jgi:hypothetical protein
VFTEPFLSNGRLLWLHSSDFERAYVHMCVCLCVCVLHVFVGKRPLRPSHGRLSPKDSIAIYHRKEIYDSVKLVSVGSGGSVMVRCNYSRVELSGSKDLSVP